MVDDVGRGHSIPELCDRLFDLVWEKRIAPALSFAGSLDLARAQSAGFRRWLTGQVAFFARYAPIVAIPPLAQELAARIRDPEPFEEAEITDIRVRFGDHVRALAKDGIVSDDDAAIFPDLFPLFDPFFLRDYDVAQQEFATVAEASACAFDQSQPSPSNAGRA